MRYPALLAVSDVRRPEFDAGAARPELSPPAVRRPRLYKGTRFSAYRFPVLLWLAAQRAATVHQTVYRFWCFAGRSASHGYRVLQDLVERGLVERYPLYPALGAASLQVLELTSAGWREVGQQRARDPRVRVEHLLQFTALCLEREADGWVLVPPPELWQSLRRYTLDRLRRPGLLEYERDVQRAIERVRDLHIGLWGIRHERTGEVRVIIPVRSLAGAARACHKLFPLRLLTEVAPLTLELCAADEELASRAAKLIEQRFAGSGRRRYRRRGGVAWPRLPVLIHVARHFNTLPHPARSRSPRVNRYAANAAPSPLTLRSATAFVATRGGGAL